MSIFSKLFGSKKSGEKLVDCNDDLPEDVFVYDDPETQVIEFDNIKDANLSRICPKDYLGIKNNSEILSKSHVAHDSNSASSNHSDVKRQSESNSFPHSLPEAIRYVVDKWGKDYLMNRGFINVLNDFKVLKDIPAAKHIITNMQTNGYIEKISLVKNWELESKSITIKYADEFGAKEDIVDYIVNCIGYGVQFSKEIPVYVESSTPIEAPNKSAPTPQQIQPQQSLDNYVPQNDLPYYSYPTLSLLDDNNSGTVAIKSVLQSPEYQNTSIELPCAIGNKEDGSLLMFDLSETPHLMISGASGMGVSVCFNTIITSLLYKKHPAEMKFILIDPKKVEFSLYSPLKNYFLAALPGNEAVITDMGEAYRTLRSVEKLINVRLDLFKEAAVRDIKSYNRKFCERKIVPINGHVFMPYFVVLIDEYDELIRTSGKGIEIFLESIARMGRATGIHLVLSVQRPVATVISAGIKANIPSRISFRVTSANDSRNILGISGAEKLQRPGDMIYTNGIDVFKARCAYTDIQEVERVNDFISNQRAYNETYKLPDPDLIEDPLQGIDMHNLDPLFEDAARLIVRFQSGSTSLVQRKFAIGYNRASRIFDQLEKAGVIGKAKGSAPRDVIIKDESSLNILLNKLR